MPEDKAGRRTVDTPQTDGSPPIIKILLAGHHKILRAGLRRLLEREPGFQVLGEAGDVTEAVRLATELKPDILLVEEGLQDSISKEVLAGFSGEGLKGGAILLAVQEDESGFSEAFSRGIRGVVLKDAGTSLLIRAIHGVMEGKIWLGNEAIASPGNKLPGSASRFGVQEQSRRFGLTRRESEIVATIVCGFSNKEIAKKFSISEDTVKHHLTSIFDKTGAGNRLELALFAIHHGLLGGKGQATGLGA
jgi:two-component system nitrate/nitrite response regulator NarL